MHYGVFSFAIRRFNLLTPGRVVEEETPTAVHSASADSFELQLVRAFGRRSNIASLDACIMCLRVTLNDVTKASPEKLTTLGAAGVVVVGDDLQAIFRHTKRKPEDRDARISQNSRTRCRRD